MSVERSSPFALTIVLLTALSFIGVGAAFIVDPTGMAAIVDIKATSTLARNDIRAIYGGVEIGLGVALLAALAGGGPERPLKSTIYVFGGLVLARSLSIALDGRPADPGALILGLELLTFTLAAAALTTLRQR
ncbi:MAG: DUF4345 family protein [Nannocystaceae bacterium]